MISRIGRGYDFSPEFQKTFNFSIELFGILLFIIPLLPHFTIFGQENAQNMSP